MTQHRLLDLNEQIRDLTDIIIYCRNSKDNPMYVRIWRKCLKDLREIRKEINELNSQATNSS